MWRIVDRNSGEVLEQVDGRMAYFGPLPWGGIHA